MDKCRGLWVIAYGKGGVWVVEGGNCPFPSGPLRSPEMLPLGNVSKFRFRIRLGEFLANYLDFIFSLHRNKIFWCISMHFLNICYAECGHQSASFGEIATIKLLGAYVIMFPSPL